MNIRKITLTAILVIATTISAMAQARYLHMYKEGAWQGGYRCSLVDSLLLNDTNGNIEIYRKGVCTEAGNYAEIDSICVGSATISLPEKGRNGEQIVPLSSLDITKITNGWGTVQKDLSIDGNTLKLNGFSFESGVGIHATAQVIVKLGGSVTRFHAVLGIDDEVSPTNTETMGRCDYSVKFCRRNGESKEVTSGELVLKANPVVVDIPISSEYDYLVIDLPEGSNNSYDHVDIADAYFEFVYQNSTPPEIVGPEALESGLNCATTVFSQPGVRFMHKIRALEGTEGTLSVKDLPDGLTFNSDRCLVEGKIDVEGEYTYTIVLDEGIEGTDPIETPVSLTVSSNLQQPTPFMGWISWNVVQGDISQSVVETVADAFISQGLYDAGYKYLAIDDLWQATSRNSDGSPQEDSTKFPEGMKAAADYVHSKGLKFGVYSDGGYNTCAGRFGSYGYEEIDANTYASWGVDLLKYDYCSNPGEDVETAKTVYKAMGDALKASGRDILFYICEWGVREPWKWGAEVGGSTWRATYDVRDCWSGVSSGVGFVQSMQGMKDLWPYCGVNRFNDADMLCVGINGTGKSSSDLCDGTPGMTKDEYRTQFAMWCMWNSPLALSFDLREAISEEDLAIMTNTEMIALDQDLMGQAAEFIGEYTGNLYVFAKDLENGDVAISITNMSSTDTEFTLDLAHIPALDWQSSYSVRDVQYRADLDDVTDGQLNAGTIRTHETKVYRLSLKTTAE